VKQQEIINAAAEQGRLIGHDGATLPSLDDLDEYDRGDGSVCPCGGTGKIRVYFGSILAQTVDCQRGCGDGH
jgi:hypothetical protein